MTWMTARFPSTLPVPWSIWEKRRSCSSCWAAYLAAPSLAADTKVSLRKFNTLLSKMEIPILNNDLLICSAVEQIISLNGKYVKSDAYYILKII